MACIEGMAGIARRYPLDRVLFVSSSEATPVLSAVCTWVRFSSFIPLSIVASAQ